MDRPLCQIPLALVTWQGSKLVLNRILERLSKIETYGVHNIYFMENCVETIKARIKTEVVKHSGDESL